MHKNLNFATDSAVIILSVILGFISVVLPPYVIPDGIQVKCDAPLFPMIATASANFAFLPTVLLLLFSGIMLGVIRPNFWFVLGFSTMALFPIADMIEIFISPSSHNLWPFQFILDVVLSAPAILGAFIGSSIRTGKWREWF